MKIYLINDNKKHLLTQKQFIYFIQLDFPRIISNKMDKLNNTLDEMKGKYKKYMKSVNTGKNKNELTEYYSKEFSFSNLKTNSLVFFLPVWAA